MNPDSNTPTWDHACEIRQRGVFGEVQCAFWKEEPSLRDALLLFDPETIREVYVVPNFISEGYFTRTVIPRELELSGEITTRSSGQVWKYCAPVGNHSDVTELLLRRAHDVAPDVDKGETTLLIVAHGTGLNDNSAVAAKREVDKIRSRKLFAAVLNLYMEEAPLVAEWEKFTTTRNIVVVPFFVSDGLHSYEDIPVLLGIETVTGISASDRERRGDVFRKNPREIRGRNLYYASAIGTEPHFADIILEQVAAFDGARNVQFVA